MTTEAISGNESKGRRATAESMAARQREISVSEFFTKNRHLLGFDNPQKALLTAVKEAVDNSLDACEEAGILPTIRVEIEELAEGRFRVTVEDNGPGIVKAQIPKIFAKLLYGSKFHRLKQSRGQQGIGISAAGMYGQLTTGRPIVIVSKTGKGRPAYRMEVRIDARSNAPEVLKDEIVPWEKEHGTSVTIEMAGLYRAGRASVASYLEQTVVANPHLELTFVPPRGEPVHYPRASEQLPPETQEIKPHPYGVELGMLIKSFQQAGDRTARQVLMEDFSRVSSAVADDLLRKAGVDPQARAARLDGPQIEAVHRVIQISQATLPPLGRLFKALQKREDKFTSAVQELGRNFTAALIDEVARRAGFEANTPARKVELSQLQRFQSELEAMQVRILPPPATCVAPIGEALIIEGLKRRFKADFYASHTRPPAVYRGNPFVVEVGLAYGGELPTDESAEVLRFANRVPLLYQPRACATTEAVVRVNWKTYGKDGGINQRSGELPVGPLAILVHVASVWVPFTNEAKEAIASYDEIVDEIRLALMECGRKLGTWVNARQAERWQRERKSLFERYIEELATSIGSITGVSRERVKNDFMTALQRHVKLSTVESIPPPPQDTDSSPRMSVSPSVPPVEEGESGFLPSVPPPPAEPTTTDRDDSQPRARNKRSSATQGEHADNKTSSRTRASSTVRSATLTPQKTRAKGAKEQAQGSPKQPSLPNLGTGSRPTAQRTTGALHTDLATTNDPPKVKQHTQNTQTRRRSIESGSETKPTERSTSRRTRR